MGLFNKSTGGIMDVIRCDEQNYLVWKWHPQGATTGSNNRENSIRWGSQLRVKEGSVAVFVNHGKDGIIQEYIEGPFDEKLDTKNLPIIIKALGTLYNGESPFQAEIYFINLAQIIQTKFAVPYFDVFDPRFLDFAVPTAVRGTISFKISDYKNFIKLHRLEDFSIEMFQDQVKDAVAKYVKSIVSNAPSDYNIPVMQLERRIIEVNDLVESNIRTRFFDDFGVTVSAVDVAVIDIDKTSEGYTQLKEVTQGVASATVQAQKEATVADIKAQQKLGVFEKAGQIFTNLKEDAYARHKATQTTNFQAYQTEAYENVGVAGAKGLGQMGANGGGGIGAGGFNPASMMAGMAVGGVVGQNVAGSINNAMSGMNPQQATQNVPPVPNQAAVYNVAVNGQSTGPFDMNTLTQMIMAGTLLRETLVWTSGMANWTKAGDVNELKPMFSEMPPVPQNK